MHVFQVATTFSRDTYYTTVIDVSWVVYSIFC